MFESSGWCPSCGLWCVGCDGSGGVAASAASAACGEGVLDSSRTAGTGGRARLTGGSDLFRLVGILKSRRRSQPPPLVAVDSSPRGLKWNILVSVFFSVFILLLRPFCPAAAAMGQSSRWVTSSRGRRRPRERRRPPEEDLRPPFAPAVAAPTSLTLSPFRKLKRK